MTIMTNRPFRYFGLIALSAGCLAAQSAVQGPVAGYVFDGSARGLRPILGLPGASLFGSPVSLGFDVSSAYVAPRQDTAFVVASDGSFHFFRLDAGTATEHAVDNLPGAPDRLVFSPTGTAAAIFKGGSIAVLKGLPDAPAVAGGVDLPAGAAFDTLAVSDDGSALLVSASNAVRLYGSFADMGKLMDTAGSALLAFAAGGHDAAMVDPAGAGVVLFHDLTGANASQALAPSDNTISASSALAFSADGNSLLLASSTGQTITAFDLSAGGRNSIACNCAPNALTRMGNLFRLNDLGGDPVWLLDTRSSNPQILFVPALSQ
jgi:hypothetical protein